MVEYSLATSKRSQVVGHGFESRTVRFQVTNSFGQAAHKHVPLSPTNIIWYRPSAGKVTAGLAESNGRLPPGGWLKVTCRLTACTPASAPGIVLRNEYGRTLPFYLHISAFKYSLPTLHKSSLLIIPQSSPKETLTLHSKVCGLCCRFKGW